MNARFLQVEFVSNGSPITLSIVKTPLSIPVQTPLVTAEHEGVTKMFVAFMLSLSLLGVELFVMTMLAVRI